MTFFKKLLFYAGLEREDFEALLPDARKENARNLEIYSLIMTAVFFALYLALFIIQGILRRNRPIYLFSALACGVIYVCEKKLTQKYPRAVNILMHAFTGVLYLFSFSLVVLHTTYPSVTAIGILLVMPLLFTERPFITMLVSIAATAVFCALCWRLKAPDVVSMDIWNAVTFLLLAMIATVFQMRNKFCSLFQAREIKYLSETDLLTGAKNRNSYEDKTNSYPQKCAIGVGCAYADVNGLHELNNRSGHVAGDTMLKTVAEAIISRFGAEDTYRVGGDEFVAFRIDSPLETLEQDARQISEALYSLGYHTSIGVSYAEKAELDMTALILSAEQNMFKEKQIYYQQFGHDRRRR